MNYLPKGLIPDDVGEKADSVNDILEKDDGLRKTMEELESTLISEKYKYFPQMAIVNNIIEEVYGKFKGNYKIVNRFLVRLEELIDTNYVLQTLSDGEGRSDQEEKLKRAKINMSEYMNEYSNNLYETIEKDNPDMGLQHIAKLVGGMNDRFINLLLERIQYVSDEDK